jgi:alkane 1-monooxygenase
VRTIIGGYSEVWSFTKTKFFDLIHEIILEQFVHLSILSLVLLCFGPKAALFAALSGFLSILMLETVNYIEHYGLQRKKDAEGLYEAPNIMHSWNAPHAITNLLLFKL